MTSAKGTWESGEGCSTLHVICSDLLSAWHCGYSLLCVHHILTVGLHNQPPLNMGRTKIRHIMYWYLRFSLGALLCQALSTILLLVMPTTAKHLSLRAVALPTTALNWLYVLAEAASWPAGLDGPTALWPVVKVCPAGAGNTSTPAGQSSFYLL
jgi:hypothetical protein